VENFRLKSHILFTVDQGRIVTVNKESGTILIIEYPEAAVWSVMIENHNAAKTELMLMSILHKSATETGNFIDQCLNTWKESGIIN